MGYIMIRKVTNLTEFKNNLSKILAVVEQGETVEIRKRDVPIALLVPFGSRGEVNGPQLGCGLGSVVVKGDLTEPMIPEENWEMIKG